MITDLFEKLLQHQRYQKLINQLDKYDWSYNRYHFLRVGNTATKIARKEGEDIETVGAASLLFDIARWLEQKK